MTSYLFSAAVYNQCRRIEAHQVALPLLSCLEKPAGVGLSLHPFTVSQEQWQVPGLKNIFHSSMASPLSSGD